MSIFTDLGVTKEEKFSNVEEPIVPKEEKKSKDSEKEKPAPAKAVEKEEGVKYVDKVDDVTKFIDEIVFNAIESDASDIHIEPQEDKIIIRYRIDGILNKAYEIAKEIEPTLMFKFKILAKLPTDEHFAPLDGRIPFSYEGRKVDTRLSILPITKGEKVVIRILSANGKAYSLQDLGIHGKDLESIQKSYAKPYGMILAVGPTGSGKTTTLYSILQILNSPGINITTVEDPVEYDLEGVNHVQINNKVDLTFANGLRAILRQDPNVIMIGEIRDSETAKIAINAALTGHIVLSTLHTNDAVTTIPRLVDMGVEKFLVASTLNLIVAQRLARRLCEECREKFKLDEKSHSELKLVRPDIAALLKTGSQVYREVGCKKCHNTGYRGRVGLYEVLEVKENVRKLISVSTNIDEIFALGRENGLTLIVEDGVNKILEGTTSIAEVSRVTALKE